MPPGPMLPANAGSPWTLEEEERLYDETRGEMPVAAIAAAHGRTTGAITARQRQMGLRDEDGRPISPLPEFRSALRSKGERRERKGEKRPDTPSPARERRQKRPSSSVLRAAGGGRKENPAAPQPALPSARPRDFPHDGDWLEKLWHALRHDVDAVLRDGRQPEAMAERAVDVALARLTPGDDFHPGAKLEELGATYGVTGERIRQVQIKAVRRLAWRVRQQGSLIAQVLKEMADSVPDEQAPLSWFATELARHDCRSGFMEFMLMAFLRRNGFPPKEARRLVEQAMSSLHRTRRAETPRRRRREAGDDVPERVRRANEFVLGILRRAVWPERLSGRSLDLAGFPALRDCRHEQSYYSRTLQRLVRYDSGGERRLIRALDVGTVVTQFAEQPVEIGYRLDGADRAYIPDLLVRTDTDLYFVIEIKARQRLADRTTLAKADAAANHLGERGIGYCLTDANGFGLDDLRALEPDDKFRRRLDALLRRDATVSRETFEGAFGRERQIWTYDQLQGAVLREGLRYDTRLIDHPHMAGRYIFDFTLRAG